MIRALHLRERRLGYGQSATPLAIGGVLVALALLSEGPAITARGWLLCFGFFSGIPVGSLVLLTIHRLTGGAWGIALAPVLRPAALCVPLVAIFFVPLALSAEPLYFWARHPTAAHIYLNLPAFLVRAALALVGWSILGIVFGCGRGSELLAALALAFYGLTIGFVAIDWFLSIDLQYTSTAFGATIAIQQILTALAAAALLAPRNLQDGDLSDLASFLIAALLGVVYLALMTFIVQWYGNLPEKARWYLSRSENGWAYIIGGCAILAVTAFAMLLLPRVRRSRGGLRLVGAVILIAVILHMSWLIIPGYSAQGGVIVAAILCFIAIGLVSLPLAGLMHLKPQQAESHAR